MRPIDLALCQTFRDERGVRWADWWMEPKINGWRIQAILEPGSVRLYGRSCAEMTGRLPQVESSLLALADQHKPGQVTVIDCEVVYLDPATGAADFEFTGAVMGVKPGEAVLRQRSAGRWLSLVAFDLPYLLGQDMTGQPIEVRRKALETICSGGFDGLQAVPLGPASRELHDDYSRWGEGSVLKRRGSRYPLGRRSPDWLKWKLTRTAEVVVMGTTPGTGANASTIGALVFGQYRNGVLTRRGQCSGMSQAERVDMARRPERWLGRVMTIKHYGVAQRAGFRHPQCVGFRSQLDKPARECVWDED